MLYIIVVNVVNVKIVVVEVIVSFTVDVVQVIVVFVVQIIVVYVAEVVRVIVVFDVVQVKVVVHIIADDFLPVDVNFRFVIFNTYSYFKLNYDSRVVIWGIFQSGMTLES